MQNNENKINDRLFSNGFIVCSILVEAVIFSMSREGRNNDRNINIHLPLMSHFQPHEVYAKMIHDINVA